jgi:hypothetical protein
MSSEAATQEDRAAPVGSFVPWDVIAVKVVADLTLGVRFADGTEGMVRFEHSHLEGVLAPLKDPMFFGRVFVNGGAVAWPGDIDLAPDAMYEVLKQQGTWVLR